MKILIPRTKIDPEPDVKKITFTSNIYGTLRLYCGVKVVRVFGCYSDMLEWAEIKYPNAEIVERKNSNGCYAEV